MKRSSRNRLNRRHLELFPEDNLFNRIARTVCHAECLPRKELFEAWEVARRIHRRIKGRSVFDLACGHALLSQILLLLDKTIPAATAIDKRLPESAARLLTVMREEWPVLNNRIHLEESDFEEADIDSESLVVSVHACGELTDRILDFSIRKGAAVALLPCCHNLKRADTGGFEGWIEPTLAVDVMRVARLHSAGYNVWTGSIPADVTPKNRLLIATKG